MVLALLPPNASRLSGGRLTRRAHNIYPIPKSARRASHHLLRPPLQALVRPLRGGPSYRDPHIRYSSNPRRPSRSRSVNRNEVVPRRPSTRFPRSAAIAWSRLNM